MSLRIPITNHDVPSVSEKEKGLCRDQWKILRMGYWNLKKNRHKEFWDSLGQWAVVLSFKVTMLFRRCSKVITGWKPRFSPWQKKTKTWRSKSLCTCLVLCWSQLQLKMPSLKLTCSPKMDGWKMILPNLGGNLGLCSGAFAVRFSGTVTESCKGWCCGPKLKSPIRDGKWGVFFF